MKKRSVRSDDARRLRASPAFGLNFSMDGRPYVGKDVEPYIQYWLSERDRLLHSLFSGRRGSTVRDAMAAYRRLTKTIADPDSDQRLRKAIDAMQAAEVLIGSAEDTSRYTAQIVEAYVAHRPFPVELLDLLISRAPVMRDTRVLDLAGGPGDLALGLAKVSERVTMMDLSRGFVDAARRRAEQRGLHLQALHESANRLLFQDDSYDVVTVSQALHWLDDVMICRGLCRVLRPGGSFFVIYGAFEVADSHPLNYLFGDQSILGRNVRQPLKQRVRPLLERLSLLFDALDAPGVDRIDLAQQSLPTGASAQRIVPSGVSLYHQQRPMDGGFARAFLTPAHIAATGLKPEFFWRDLERRCANAQVEDLQGTYDWAVLHFRRGGARLDADALEHCPIVDIGYAPPAGI